MAKKLSPRARRRRRGRRIVNTLLIVLIIALIGAIAAVTGRYKDSEYRESCRFKEFRRSLPT